MLRFLYEQYLEQNGVSKPRNFRQHIQESLTARNFLTVILAALLSIPHVSLFYARYNQEPAPTGISKADIVMSFFCGMVSSVISARLVLDRAMNSLPLQLSRVKDEFITQRDRFFNNPRMAIPSLNVIAPLTLFLLAAAIPTMFAVNVAAMDDEKIKMSAIGLAILGLTSISYLAKEMSHRVVNLEPQDNAIMRL